MKYISSRFILSKQIKKKSCVIIDHELGLSSIRNCFETMILGNWNTDRERGLWEEEIEDKENRRRKRKQKEKEVLPYIE